MSENETTPSSESLRTLAAYFERRAYDTEGRGDFVDAIERALDEIRTRKGTPSFTVEDVSSVVKKMEKEYQGRRKFDSNDYFKIAALLRYEAFDLEGRARR